MVSQNQAIQFANTILNHPDEHVDYLFYLDAMNDMYCDSYLANCALDALGYHVQSDGGIVSSTVKEA